VVAVPETAIVNVTGCPSVGVPEGVIVISGSEPTVTLTVAVVAVPVPTVAVTVASRLVTKTACAWPFEDVLLTALDRLPLSVLNDTWTPLRGLPLASVTVAVMIDGLPGAT
jgi:hypothetical protein